MMRMYPVKYSSLKPVLLYYEFYGLIIISANKIKQHSFSLQFMNFTVSIFCKKEKKSLLHAWFALNIKFTCSV